MTGTTLSHYKVVSELGRGGMGIVYLAEDTKLDRRVAIKVLPSSALASEDDRARFYREAKAAAALNHPHIAQIYQIDEAVPSDAPHGTQPSPFIAMEYIDGEPLDTRIKQGPLKLSEAVRLATQIAGALGEAHEKGIVHRDVKASNVMLTSKGDAKVLDFGLALTAASTKLTRMGSTLGTVAYMSPEQARGEEVDSRTDLWALGVVLYEMVAGRNPFGGDYEQAVVYSILNAEPEPLTAVRTGVPMQLEWIVDKCLSKDADSRYQTAADLIVDLRNLEVKSPSGLASRHASGHMPGITRSQSGKALYPGGVGPVARADRPATRRLVFAGLAITAVLICVALYWVFQTFSAPGAPPAPLTRVELSFRNMRGVAFPKLSPVRDWMIFLAADPEGRQGLFLRNMATGAVRYIERTELGGAREAGFSPDGSRIAFTRGTNGGVFSVVVPTGIPERITEEGRFAFWLDSNTIVMSDDSFGGGDSYRVSLDGGETEVINVVNPQLKPGYTNVLKTHAPGTNLAFGHQLVRSATGGLGDGAPNLFVLDMGSGELTIIESNAINPEYVGHGLLMYQIRDDDGRLVVRPVDRSTGVFTGQPMDVFPDGEIISWSQYGVSTDGDLFYMSDPDAADGIRSLWLVNLVDETVRNLSAVFSLDTSPEWPRFSPDGRRVVYESVKSMEADVFAYDLETDRRVQYTFDGRGRAPVFDREGDHIYYSIVSDSSATIARVAADRGAPGQPFIIMEDAVEPVVSPDGRLLAALRVDRQTPTGVVVHSLETGTDVWSEPVETLALDFDFSPDNRYLAYSVFTEDQQSSGIEIRSVDGVERFTIPVSTRNDLPRWSGDGRYLYFNSLTTLFRIPVRTSPAFDIIGQPESVLTTPRSNGFDVSPDGEHLVISAPAVNIGDQSVEAPILVWLQNWGADVARQFDR